MTPLSRFPKVFPRLAKPRLRTHFHTLSCLVLAALALDMAGELRGEELSAADLPELTAACRLIEPYVVGNTILVGRDDPRLACDSRRSCIPFPPNARILAYEENTHFVCASGEASKILRSSQPAEDGLAGTKWFRRFIHLKPDVFVVDDFLQGTSTEAALRWMIGCRRKPTVDSGQLFVGSRDQELVCATLRPPKKTFQEAGRDPQVDEGVYPFALEQEAAACGTRFLHVLYLRKPSDSTSWVRSALGKVLNVLHLGKASGTNLRARSVPNKDSQLELEIATLERVFRLELPPPGADAGWISIHTAEGNPLVWRRPLPSGILPHGPDGAGGLEVWDNAFRSRRAAEWDKGGPALKLKQAVEQGVIKPCRAVDLGCGSGNDAIYLASQGFEVTAIDIAPTALSMATDKAEKAGVHVNWVLADVLAAPELGSFDFIFDRGCYHNVRYVNAAAYVQSLRQLSRPGTRCLILSLNGDGPTGVRERHMRDDFSSWFEIERLEQGGIEDRAGHLSDSWLLMLRGKTAE